MTTITTTITTITTTITTTTITTITTTITTIITIVVGCCVVVDHAIIVEWLINKYIMIFDGCY